MRICNQVRMPVYQLTEEVLTFAYKAFFLINIESSFAGPTVTQSVMGFKEATLSIPFKVLTNKANPVDAAQIRPKCFERKGEEAPRTYGKEINIYRHQHWSLTNIYNSNSGRLRAESTFFPLCKIINMVK